MFNPTARGNKAKRFRRRLEALARECVLMPTAGPGVAVDLAAQAVRQGFDTVVAAGGDGTVNEVLNGIAGVEHGLERARLGILPLGTMNVFARELGLPLNPDAAWRLVRQGNETTVDLPWAEFEVEGRTARRCFAQLAGAGLDSRAIEFVDWTWKTRIGSLAYAAAGLRAMRGFQPLVTVTLPDGTRSSGELVLVGNGTLYGGCVTMFPGASLRDGLLEIRVLPRVGVLTLARFALSWLFRGGFVVPGERHLRADRFTLTSDEAVPFQVDGDNAGPLPVRFSVRPRALRVIAP
ncbi:MAG TPA: diacylglycerol kinase family lipid kinase [Candidatus Paceibacterota bacterium]|nr:diacylglycerol kinase family lipid kinase [Candidatus Paceibacterota bacterium]